MSKARSNAYKVCVTTELRSRQIVFFFFFLYCGDRVCTRRVMRREVLCKFFKFLSIIIGTVLLSLPHRAVLLLHYDHHRYYWRGRGQWTCGVLLVDVFMPQIVITSRYWYLIHFSIFLFLLNLLLCCYCHWIEHIVQSKVNKYGRETGNYSTPAEWSDCNELQRWTMLSVWRSGIRKTLWGGQLWRLQRILQAIYTQTIGISMSWANELWSD